MQAGQLVGVVDASATPARDLWRLTTMDAAGRPIDERLGSNIQLLNGYDDTTGLLETRTAGVAGATTLQDLEYTWDDGDKLTSRIDHNQGGLTETFAYDELNRLDRSWRNGVLNLDVAYDSFGNIASKFEEGAGTLAYQYHPTKEARRNGGRSQCLYVRRQRQYAEPGTARPRAGSASTCRTRSRRAAGTAVSSGTGRSAGDGNRSRARPA
jgi:hypothetical protein